MANPKIKKDEELSPELYRVAREKGTEAPFTGKYYKTKDKGMYRCAVCGSELFSSDAKFDSYTGWPSFTEPSKGLSEKTLEGEPANLTNVELRDDMSLGMKRTEVVCKSCGAHLGHVFDDGPIINEGGPPSPGAPARRAKRYCINSVCLELKKRETSL